MTNRFDVFTHHYFPFHFIALGVGMIITSIVSVPFNFALAIILFIAGFVFTTSHHRLRIDLEHNSIKEYLWILGLKNGEELSILDVELIYINKVKVSTAYGFVARVNVDQMIFKGFIKMTSEETVFLGESKNEEKLLSKMRLIAEILNLEIRKNS